MNVVFNECLYLFKQNQKEGLCERTVERKINEIKRFLFFLEKHDVCSFENFDIRIVYDYLSSLNFASQTISGIQFAIREFFNTIKKHDMSEIDGYQIFTMIFTNKRDRILSYYKTDEIKDIISRIDINNPNGLRDKCVILLAAQTGLRAGDILGLTFDEILWDKDLISKIQ